MRTDLGEISEQDFAKFSAMLESMSSEAMAQVAFDAVRQLPDSSQGIIQTSLPAKMAAEESLRVDSLVEEFIAGVSSVNGDNQVEQRHLAEAIKKIAGRLHVLGVTS